MSVRPAAADPVVLVHGSMHGAWCWERVVSRLHAEGVAATALDLPGHGTRVAEWREASRDSYVACVTDALTAAGRPCVLVGHSMAGQIVASAATALPEAVSVLVLLNAQVLLDGETSLDTLPTWRQRQYRELARRGGGRYRLDDAEIHRRWLQDLPVTHSWTVRALAAVTPQPLRPLVEPATGQDFGAAGVSAIYVRSDADVGHPAERADRFVRRLPADVPVLSVPGGHDCMISQPDPVADLLARYARHARAVAVP